MITATQALAAGHAPKQSLPAQIHAPGVGQVKPRMNAEFICQQ